MVSKQQGFTIIELVVVIVILGILAAVAFPKFQDLSGDAKSAVVSGAVAAMKSSAVIGFAKNRGTKVSFASVTGGMSVDPTITLAGDCTSTTSAKVGYQGALTISVDLTEYCV